MRRVRVSIVLTLSLAAPTMESAVDLELIRGQWGLAKAHTATCRKHDIATCPRLSAFCIELITIPMGWILRECQFHIT